MNERQLADLEAQIETWIDQHCDKSDWPDVFVGQRTAAFMAQAAAAAFDACVESQAYAKREGFMKSGV